MWKRRQRNTDEEAAPAANSRQPNKLSKPRTNKHIPATASKQAGKRESRRDLPTPPLESPELYYQPTISSADKHDLRRQAHSHIFGSSRDALSVLDDISNKDGIYDEDGPDVSGSVASQSPTVANRTSLKSFALASHSKLNDGISTSQVSLVVEEDADLPPAPTRPQRFSKLNSTEDLSHLSELMCRNVELVADKGIEDHTSYADLRDASPDETSAEEPVDGKAVKVMRRSSFATPGVATRQPRAGEMSPLSSHPIYEEDVEIGEAWTQHLPPLPSRQNYLATSSHINGITTPLARAQTPAESVDYGRIGTMQLGNLVITNGKASPEPSILTARQKTPVHSLLDFHWDEEYFTASEGDLTPVASPIGTAFGGVYDGRTQGQYEDRSNANLAPQSAENLFDLPWHEKYKPEQRSSSPLKQEMLASKPSNEDFTFSNMGGEETRLQITPPKLMRSASQFARGYLSELPESPYEPQIARAVSVKRITVSRTASGQSAQSAQSESVYSVASDEGFAEPAPRRPPPAPPLEEIKEDVKRRTVASFEAELVNRFDADVSHQQAGEDLPLEQTPPKSARPTQTKADSGYSSSASVLDALSSGKENDDSMTEENLSEEEDDFQLSNPKKRLSKASDIISLYTFDQMLSKLPPVAAHYMEPQKPRMAANKPKRISLLRSVSWGKAKSEAAFASTTSVPTIASVKTMPTVPYEATTVGAKAGKDRKKLQKLRPRARTAVSMPSPRPLTADEVPRIPSRTRTQHTNRLSQNPDASHVARILAANGGDQKEDEQFLGPSFEIRFPSPSPESESEDEYGVATKAKRRSLRMSRRFTDETPEERPPTPPQHRTGVSSMFRRASRSNTMERKPRRSFEEDDAIIADFATAAVSLGSSPYDIASTDTTRSRNRPKINTNNTTVIHPHQISTNVSRPKSWIEMDDATAAEFARQKSRQRAEMAEAWDAATGGMAPPTRSRPGKPQRPNSFHETLAMFGSRTPSVRSVTGIGQSGGMDDGSSFPRRVPSGGSDYRRGRPQSFHEWELNRRNSRSRSRSRAGMLAGNAPPVPPLPAQTLERDEEQNYPSAPPKQEQSGHGKPAAQERPRSWRFSGKFNSAPEVPLSVPEQPQQPADWSASSDIWRQRRMLLSKNLQTHTREDTEPSAAGRQVNNPNSSHAFSMQPMPTSAQQTHRPISGERDWLQFDPYDAPRLDFSLGPAPPPHAQTQGTWMADAPAGSADPYMSPDLERRRPTPFERVAGSSLNRPSRLM